MQHVAFFRNLNQGQRGHPRTADLLEAFTAAGVSDATPFRSNGTVVFTSDDGDRVVEDVQAELDARSVFHDVVYARPLELVELVVARHRMEPDFTRRELTVFPVGDRLPEGLTATTEARLRQCEVVESGIGHAVVLNSRDRQSNGTPTVEALLHVPATSRGLPTLLRLVERFSPCRLRQ